MNKLKNIVKADASVLILGTLVSQLVPLLLQPILRRIYNPEDFGSFALYFSALTIGAFISTFSYHNAITLPKKDKDAIDLVKGIIGISFVVNSLILLALIILNIINPEYNFGIGNLIFFLPLSIFLNSLHLIFTNWFTRKKGFKDLAINKIVRRSGEGIGQISLKFIFGPIGLLFGNIFGDICNISTFSLKSKKDIISGKVDRTNIKKNLRTYKNFPLTSFIPSLLNVSANFFPIFITAAIFSKEVTGYIDLSRQVLAIPLALVSTSISNVLLQRFSDAVKDRKHINRLALSYVIPLTILGALGIFVLFLFGEELFSFVFGLKNKTSGSFSEILVFYYAVAFVVSPFSSIFFATEKLIHNSLWQIFRFCSVGSLFFLEFSGPFDCIYHLTLIESFNYLVYGVLITGQIIQYEKSLP